MKVKDIKHTYYSRAYSALVGKTVAYVRPMLPEEVADFAWEGMDEGAVLVVFTDGTVLVPQSDPEGNHPGYLLVDEGALA
jgi:hypothetical protein